MGQQKREDWILSQNFIFLGNLVHRIVIIKVLQYRSGLLIAWVCDLDGSGAIGYKKHISHNHEPTYTSFTANVVLVTFYLAVGQHVNLHAIAIIEYLLQVLLGDHRYWN